MGSIFQEEHPEVHYIQHSVRVVWATKNYCVNCKRNREVKGVLGRSVDSKSQFLEVTDYVALSGEDGIFQYLDFRVEVIKVL